VRVSGGRMRRLGEWRGRMTSGNGVRMASGAEKEGRAGKGASGGGG
jgi:hypothetical protein